MKKLRATVLMAGFALLSLAGFVPQSAAEVNINVGIHAGPPAYVFHAPPPVVVIPRTYVYAVPDAEISILFHSGYWWRPHGGHWYRARSYNGPWGYIAPAHVPRAVIGVPSGYYHVPPGHRHIPHGQLKKNWKKWERDKHWARDERWHDDRNWKRDGDHRRGRDDHRDFRDNRDRRDHDDRGKHKGKGKGRDD